VISLSNLNCTYKKYGRKVRIKQKHNLLLFSPRPCAQTAPESPTAATKRRQWWCRPSLTDTVTPNRNKRSTNSEKTERAVGETKSECNSGISILRDTFAMFLQAVICVFGIYENFFFSRMFGSMKNHSVILKLEIFFQSTYKIKWKICSSNISPCCVIFKNSFHMVSFHILLKAHSLIITSVYHFSLLV